MSDASQLQDKKYGSCEGPNAEYVKLKSSNDVEFIIKKEFANQSGTIRAMLSGPGQFAENETNIIHFKDMPSYVLDVVCKYFMFKARYDGSDVQPPDFYIPPQMALEVLMAANFLDC